MSDPYCARGHRRVLVRDRLVCNVCRQLRRATGQPSAQPLPASPSTHVLEWMKDATCLGSSALFFSNESDERDRTRGICADCPVIEECRDWTRQVKPSEGAWAGRVVGERTEEDLQARSPARQRQRLHPCPRLASVPHP